MRAHTFLEVKLSLLKDNIKTLQKAHPKKEILFMVKANAYGHGASKIVDYLSSQKLVKNFGVAGSGEADQILSEVPHFEGVIYVFSDFALDDYFFEKWSGDARLRWVIHHPCLLPVLDKISPEHVVLHFDTGMNRLGFKEADIQKVTSKLNERGIKKIHHLMSHFANSYLHSENKKTLSQKENFQRVLSQLQELGFEIENHSFSNSGALEQQLVEQEKFMRPGLMLYGPASTPDNFNKIPMKNISSLKCRPLKIEKMKKGTPIGYGSNPLPADGLLCILPIGYGDGFLTYYSGAKLTVSGMPGRVVGRINMDLTYVLFPLECEEKLLKCEYLEFWNHDPATLREFSDSVKTIPYQVTCALNTRVVRRYIE